MENENATILNVLIIDDEPANSMHLSALLKNFPFIRVAGTLTGSEGFAEKLRDEVDLIFLDICIGKENGFSLADYVNHYYPGKMIVFVSGFDHFMQDSYTFEPFDFLVKPVEITRLEKTMLRAQKKKYARRENRKTNLGIPTKSGTIFVPVQSILYVEHVRRKSMITLMVNNRTETIATTESMASLGAILEEYDFVRVHQSFLVPTGKIASLAASRIGTGYELTLFDCDKKIPVSRSVFKELQEQLRRDSILP